jgi:hypothetical protein
MRRNSSRITRLRTDHYLREHYERVDPVIVEALTATEPFE